METTLFSSKNSHTEKQSFCKKALRLKSNEDHFYSA